MPIYEFYCRDCHTIYSFFARRPSSDQTPACPKNGKHKLARQMSRIAILKGGSSSSEEGDMPDINEDRMEQAMMQLAGEMDGMNEDDPRAVAQMMRKLMNATGMSMGEGMEEAVRRMEAGEDPDQVEEELGGLLDHEEPFLSGESKLKGVVRRLSEAPNVDPEMYDM